MDSRDYERALAVLDRCVRIESVDAFGEEFLEALGSVYGCVHTAFFRTRAFTRTFADPAPVLNGRLPKIIDEYRGRWFPQDVMFTRESIARIGRYGVSSLTQLRPQQVPATARAYLDDFVFRRGFRSVCAIDLELPAGQRGVAGVFHETPDGLSRADLAGFAVIVRQLSPVARRLPASAGSPAALASLPPRLREVATLIGEGCSNATIARRTGLALDSVKKYTSQVLAETGCTNRTELALLVAGGR
ncbi:response regulator transcription factor [Actinomycetospora flava]|uniref:Sigma factor-like helix-turn-helix DNA-binding protein n=1 Tax=Actinomycetospora flava TaxID=3129232 RepID=A0ABU8M934_9PSEU